MNIERDQYLMEAMGLCTNYDPDHNGECLNCDEFYGGHVILFSSWEGFGKLWEWANTQKWWKQFGAELIYTPESNPEAIDYDGNFPEELINPDKFADAVYQYLKEQK